MMCYKDKTWCTEKSCNNSNDCPDYLTKEDQEEAVTWMGPDAPIAIYTERMSCYTPRNMPEGLRDMVGGMHSAGYICAKMGADIDDLPEDTMKEILEFFDDEQTV